MKDLGIGWPSVSGSRKRTLPAARVPRSRTGLGLLDADVEDAQTREGAIGLQCLELADERRNGLDGDEAIGTVQVGAREAKAERQVFLGIGKRRADDGVPHAHHNLRRSRKVVEWRVSVQPNDQVSIPGMNA